MTTRREDALEACLLSLRQGASLQAALEAHSELADELRPLLEAAQAADSLSVEGLPRLAIVRSRTRLLQRAAVLRPERKPRFSLPSLVARPALSIAVIAMALMLGVGAVGAAGAQSLPGDSLYPAKLIAEDVLLQLASDPASRLRLEEAYLEQRAEEVRRLLALGRVQSVSFIGLVEQATLDGYLVAGIPVRVAPDTRRLGDIRVGTHIEVEGLTQADGVVLAHELHLQAYDMFGVVESIAPETWVVSRVSLTVTRDSVIEDGLNLGDRVIVGVLVDDLGGLSIDWLERFSPPSPTPAPTLPPPTATQPPTPSATPIPLANPGEGEASGTEEADHEGPSTDEPDETDEPEQMDEPDDDGEEGESQQDKEFTGVVQSIGSIQWTIGGEVVAVDGDTEIRDDPQVGDWVKVKLQRRPDGTWWAERIERDD
jgi:Domain of unknown function (DUF5666)